MRAVVDVFPERGDPPMRECACSRGARSLFRQAEGLACRTLNNRENAVCSNHTGALFGGDGTHRDIAAVRDTILHRFHRNSQD